MAKPLSAAAMLLFSSGAFAAVTVQQLPSAATYTMPMAVSDGGVFIVGYAQSRQMTARSYRWDAAWNISDLGDPPSHYWNRAIIPQGISEMGRSSPATTPARSATPATRLSLDERGGVHAPVRPARGDDIVRPLRLPGCGLHRRQLHGFGRLAGGALG